MKSGKIFVPFILLIGISASAQSGDERLIGVWRFEAQFQENEILFRPDGQFIFDKKFVQVAMPTERGRYQVEGDLLTLLPGNSQPVQYKMQLRGNTMILSNSELPEPQTYQRRPGSREQVLAQMRPVTTAMLSGNGDTFVGIWRFKQEFQSADFTLRPDGRYISAHEVGGQRFEERGSFQIDNGKITFTPYKGNGEAKTFDLDLFDAQMTLTGGAFPMPCELQPGSAAEVIDNVHNPDGLKIKYGPLVGAWNFADQLSSIEVILRPDGRYHATGIFASVRLDERGKYKIEKASRKLTLDPRTEEAQTYDMDLYGNTMTLSGGNYATPFTYHIDLQKIEEVLERVRRADAQKAHDDGQWRERIPIGPMSGAAIHVPVGEVPADPNPRHVFNASTLFTGQQLYLSLTPVTLKFTNGSTRQVFNSWKWYFHPTGRVFVRTETFRLSGSYDAYNPRGEVTTYWGAYRITPGTEAEPAYVEENVLLETDGGEKIAMTLEDGRRVILWGKKLYGQVDWENEALRRMQGK